MKNRLLLLIISILSWISGYAQNNYSLLGLYSDGKMIKPDDIFLLGDGGLFSIRNDVNETIHFEICKWTFDCLKNDLSYQTEREIDNVDEFIFFLDTLNLKTEILSIIEFENDSSRYFRAQITCRGQSDSGENIDLAIPVYLNLLPSIPRFEVLDIKYDTIQDYSSINLRIKAERAESYSVGHRYYMYNKPPWSTYWDRVSLEDAENYFSWSNCPDIIDFRIASINKFGSSITGYYYYSDFLTSIIDNKKDNPLSVYPNPVKDVLNIDGDHNNIAIIRIIDISGKIVKHITDSVNTIDLSTLSEGLYILEVLNKNYSNRHFLKIIKTQ